MNFIKMFNMIDSDHSGEITHDELVAFMKANNYKDEFVEKWLDLFDLNNRGRITMEDYCERLGLEIDENMNARFKEQRPSVLKLDSLDSTSMDNYDEFVDVDSNLDQQIVHVSVDKPLATPIHRKTLPSTKSNATPSPRKIGIRDLSSSEDSTTSVKESFFSRLFSTEKHYPRNKKTNANSKQSVESIVEDKVKAKKTGALASHAPVRLSGRVFVQDDDDVFFPENKQDKTKKESANKVKPLEKQNDAIIVSRDNEQKIENSSVTQLNSQIMDNDKKVSDNIHFNLANPEEDKISTHDGKKGINLFASFKATPSGKPNTKDSENEARKDRYNSKNVSTEEVKSKNSGDGLTQGSSKSMNKDDFNSDNKSKQETLLLDYTKNNSGHSNYPLDNVVDVDDPRDYINEGNRKGIHLFASFKASPSNDSNVEDNKDEGTMDRMNLENVPVAELKDQNLKDDVLSRNKNVNTESQNNPKTITGVNIIIPDKASPNNIKKDETKGLHLFADFKSSKSNLLKDKGRKDEASKDEVNCKKDSMGEVSDRHLEDDITPGSGKYINKDNTQSKSKPKEETKLLDDSKMYSDNSTLAPRNDLNEYERKGIHLFASFKTSPSNQSNAKRNEDETSKDGMNSEKITRADLKDEVLSKNLKENTECKNDPSDKASPNNMKKDGKKGIHLFANFKASQSDAVDDEGNHVETMKDEINLKHVPLGDVKDQNLDDETSPRNSKYLNKDDTHSKSKSGPGTNNSGNLNSILTKVTRTDFNKNNGEGIQLSASLKASPSNQSNSNGNEVEATNDRINLKNFPMADLKGEELSRNTNEDIESNINPKHITGVFAYPKYNSGNSNIETSDEKEDTKGIHLFANFKASKSNVLNDKENKDEALKDEINVDNVSRMEAKDHNSGDGITAGSSQYKNKNVTHSKNKPPKEIEILDYSKNNSAISNKGTSDKASPNDLSKDEREGIKSSASFKASQSNDSNSKGNEDEGTEYRMNTENVPAAELKDKKFKDGILSSNNNEDIESKSKPLVNPKYDSDNCNIGISDEASPNNISKDNKKDDHLFANYNGSGSNVITDIGNKDETWKEEINLKPVSSGEVNDQELEAGITPGSSKYIKKDDTHSKSKQKHVTEISNVDLRNTADDTVLSSNSKKEDMKTFQLSASFKASQSNEPSAKENELETLRNKGSLDNLSRTELKYPNLKDHLSEALEENRNNDDSNAKNNLQMRTPVMVGSNSESRTTKSKADIFLNSSSSKEGMGHQLVEPKSIDNDNVANQSKTSMKKSELKQPIKNKIESKGQNVEVRKDELTTNTQYDSPGLTMEQIDKKDKELFFKPRTEADVEKDLIQTSSSIPCSEIPRVGGSTSDALIRPTQKDALGNINTKGDNISPVSSTMPNDDVEEDPMKIAMQHPQSAMPGGDNNITLTRNYRNSTNDNQATSFSNDKLKGGNVHSRDKIGIDEYRNPISDPREDSGNTVTVKDKILINKDIDLIENNSTLLDSSRLSDNRLLPNLSTEGVEVENRNSNKISRNPSKEMAHSIRNQLENNKSKSALTKADNEQNILENDPNNDGKDGFESESSNNYLGNTEQMRDSRGSDEEINRIILKTPSLSIETINPLNGPEGCAKYVDQECTKISMKNPQIMGYVLNSSNRDMPNDIIGIEPIVGHLDEGRQPTQERLATGNNGPGDRSLNSTELQRQNLKRNPTASDFEAKPSPFSLLGVEDRHPKVDNNNRYSDQIRLQSSSSLNTPLLLDQTSHLSEKENGAVHLLQMKINNPQLMGQNIGDSLYGIDSVEPSDIKGSNKNDYKWTELNPLSQQKQIENTQTTFRNLEGNDQRLEDVSSETNPKEIGIKLPIQRQNIKGYEDPLLGSKDNGGAGQNQNKIPLSISYEDINNASVECLQTLSPDSNNSENIDVVNSSDPFLDKKVRQRSSREFADNKIEGIDESVDRTVNMDRLPKESKSGYKQEPIDMPTQLVPSKENYGVHRVTNEKADNNFKDIIFPITNLRGFHSIYAEPILSNIGENDPDDHANSILSSEGTPLFALTSDPNIYVAEANVRNFPTHDLTFPVTNPRRLQLINADPYLSDIPGMDKNNRCVLPSTTKCLSNSPENLTVNSSILIDNMNKDILCKSKTGNEDDRSDISNIPDSNKINAEKIIDQSMEENNEAERKREGPIPGKLKNEKHNNKWENSQDENRIIDSKNNLKPSLRDQDLRNFESDQRKQFLLKPIENTNEERTVAIKLIPDSVRILKIVDSSSSSGDLINEVVKLYEEYRSHMNINYAEVIKRHLDKYFGPVWHVIIATEEYGFHFSYEESVIFEYRDLVFAIWRLTL